MNISIRHLHYIIRHCDYDNWLFSLLLTRGAGRCWNTVDPCRCSAQIPLLLEGTLTKPPKNLPGSSDGPLRRPRVPPLGAHDALESATAARPQTSSAGGVQGFQGYRLRIRCLVPRMLPCAVFSCLAILQVEGYV